MAHEESGQPQSDEYVFSQPYVPTPDRGQTPTAPAPAPRRLSPEQQKQGWRAHSLPPSRSTGQQR